MKNISNNIALKKEIDVTVLFHYKNVQIVIGKDTCRSPPIIVLFLIFIIIIIN